MITIQLKFPTGKWHATPWGRQVNEGAVEWPPSPWRILRALLAVWHHKHFDVSEEQMRTLIDALAEEMPVYQLPITSAGHTRHYMKAKPKRHKSPEKDHPGGKPEMIFDAFYSISPNERVLVHWPNTTLSNEQLALLDSLLRSMSYFGRAESWVEASLSEWEGIPNAVPLNGHEVTQRQELSHLLAPGSIEEYSDWRSTHVEDQQQKRLREKQAAAEAKGKPTDKIKLTKKDLEKIDASVPEDLFASLHMETSELRKSGWNRPPASEWVRYVVDKQENERVTSPKGTVDCHMVARFAIASAVRPKLTDAVFIGERVRTSLLKISNGDGVFVGRNSDNEPAKGHMHAHYLCESNDDHQGRVTHLSVFAPDGLNHTAEEAVRRFRKAWGKGGHDLQFVLIGIGAPKDFGGSNEKAGQSPMFATSETWTSRTPFVPADQLRRKYNVANANDRQMYEKDLFRIIRKEFARRPWLEAYADKLESVTWLGPQTELGNTKTSWLKFHQRRTKGGGQRGNTSGVGVKLQFNTAIRGPIAIGYGSHFGLGVFVPERK